METKKIDLGAVSQTAIKVIISPAGFFKEMPKAGGFIEPLVFMVIMGVIGGVMQSVFSLAGFDITAGVAGGAASVIILPVMIAVFGFIGAAILFVIWKVMGSQESYETAYRCGAYVSAITPITTVLGLVPYIGNIVGIALVTFYFVIASKEVHRIASQKAWLVFGVIGTVIALIGVSGEIVSKKLVQDAARFQREAEEAAREMQKQAEQMNGLSEKDAGEVQQQMEEAMGKLEQMKKQQEGSVDLNDKS